VFIGPFFTITRLASVLLLGVWFLIQLADGIGSIANTSATDASGGVAYWAHIGGFVFGFVVTMIFAATRGMPTLPARETRGSY
jgi:membrane associated rhomboid family serine protease